MKRSFLHIIAYVSLSLVSAGCGVFTHYTDRVGPVRGALRTGDVMGAKSLLEQNRTNSETDKLAYLLEQGMLEHVDGKNGTSNQVFFQASDAIDARDMRARVSLGKSLEQFGSVLINEKTMAYEAEGFERVFMHSVQAINFIMKGDKSGARVEIKKAYNEAQLVQELNRKKLEKVQDKLALENQQGRQLNQKQILAGAHQRIFNDPDFSSLQEQASVTANAYENAFAYYLSSLVYEINGDYNDAYIDCKKTLELRPDFLPAQDDLIRLAALSGFRQEKDAWIARFGEIPERPDDAGDLIVVLQNGVAPEKKQIWLPIPIPGVGIQSVAFPIYKPVRYRSAGARVCNGSAVYCETEMLANISGMAVRNYLDRVPELVLRTAIRFSVKGVATYQLGNEAGGAGALIGMALTAITEQADLRSWLLMPAEVQVTRLPMAPGKHLMDIALVDSSGHTLDCRKVTIEIQKGKMTFVNMRGIDSFVGDIQIAPAQ